MTRIFAILAAVLLFASSAQAKLIAVVFDTSGSMYDRYNLPSFGIELLAATIDGRAGFDRFKSLNFDQYGANCGDFIPEAATISRLPCNMRGAVLNFDPNSTQSQRGMVQDLHKSFGRADGGTPYGPLEVMLDSIATDIKPGEEAILIVVSDGGYHKFDLASVTPFDNGALVPQMRRSFETYRDRILEKGGSLSVEYLFIDASNGANETIIRDQGVRDTLLSVFNGDQRGPSGELLGSWLVSGKDALWSALTDIVAQVAGTDRQAQSAFIRYDSADIWVNSPLSINHVVVVATGNKGRAIPQLTDNNFPVAPLDTRSISTSMDQGDELFDYVQLGGRVDHLWFEPPLPSGEYTFHFDSPVTNDVFLLFETSSKSDLRVFDATGAEILPDSNGVITLFMERDYRLQTQILDGAAGDEVVDLANLPSSLTMAVTLEGPQGRSVHSMDIDRTNNQGSYAWSPAERGEFIARSRASAGIMSPESSPVTIVVLDARTDLTVSAVTPSQDCATCGPGVIGSAVTLQPDDVQIGSFQVSAQADLNGQISFADTQLPDGYEIRTDAGQPIDLSQPIDFGGQETRTFQIWRPGAVDLDVLALDGLDLDISVAPAGGWAGPTASQTTTVKLTAPDMRMQLVSVTQPITPGTTDGLVVPGGELVRGQFAAEFALLDIVAPLDPDHVYDLVSVDTEGMLAPLLRYNLSFPDPGSVGFNALELRPKTSFWCLCFLGLGNAVTGTDNRLAKVTYSFEVDGVTLQSASADLPLSLPVGRSQLSLSCALNLLYLLLFAMFLRGLVALATTHRFPRGSLIEIAEGSALPRFKRLDKGNSVWWKAWFALFTGNPDEVRIVEGLRIKATRKGGEVDLSKSTPPWRLDRMGQTFAEIKEARPKLTSTTLVWGDRLENTDSPALVLKFKKRSTDH